MTAQELAAYGITKEMRTPCEVWTRVMGYHRPTSSFNPGKQSEHAERVCFDERAAGRLLT